VLVTIYCKDAISHLWIGPVATAPGSVFVFPLASFPPQIRYFPV